MACRISAAPHKRESRSIRFVLHRSFVLVDRMKAAKPGHFPQLRQITLSKLSELPKRPAGAGRWARRMSCAERRRYINYAKKRGKRNVGSCPRAAENQIHPVSALRIGKTSHLFWPECVRGIRFNVKRDEKRRPDWIRAPENSPGDRRLQRCLFWQKPPPELTTTEKT